MTVPKIDREMGIVLDRGRGIASDELRNALAEARTGLGEDASDDHRRALELAREIVARHEECRALIGLGEDAAALELARRYGFRLVGRRAFDLSAGEWKQY